MLTLVARARRRYLTLLPLFLLVLALGCSKKGGDEAEIRRAVSGAAEAAEAKDVKGFMSFISKGYGDDSGNDYDAVKGIIFHQFMRPGPLSVYIRGVDIEVEGDRAVVNARAALVRGRDKKGLGSVIPQDAEAYGFSLVFRKEGGRWRVTSAAWEAMGAAGLL